MGLGLFLAVDGGSTTRFSHLGSNAGFTAALDASAADGTGAVAMTNRHSGWEVVLRAVVTASAAYS
jgi:hypothetical protein